MADILQTPGANALPKSQPIVAQVPFSAQLAAKATQPSRIAFGEAYSNHRESIEVLKSVEQRNLKALSSLSPIIADKLKEGQEREFQDGFLRQMQGTSVKGIAEEQPFSGLFGDGAAVRGARASQQMAAATALDMYVAQNKGDLSRMSLDEQRAALGNFVQELATGDEEADMMTANAAIQRFPAMLDNLARSADAEAQHAAAAQQADAVGSHASALSLARQEVVMGKMSPTYFGQLQEQALEVLKPLPGQSSESYRNGMQSAAIMHAKNGNFDMVALIQDEVLTHALTPDEQMRFDGQMKMARAEWLKDNPVSWDYEQYSQGLGVQISGGRYMTVADLTSEIEQVNARYMAETGSVTPVIDNAERGRYMAMWDQQQQREAEKAEKLGQTELDEYTKRTAYIRGMATGSPSQMEASGLSAQEKYAIDVAEADRFLTEQPGGPSGVVVGKLAAQGMVNKPLQERLNSTLAVLTSGGVPSEEKMDQFRLAFLKMENTPQGIATLDAYFGDDMEMARAVATVPMTPDNRAYFKQLAEGRKLRLAVPQETMQRAQEVVKNEFTPSWWSRFTGDSRQLGAGFLNALQADMVANVGTVMQQQPNLTEEEVMKIAASRSMRNKDMAGDYLIGNSKPGAFLNAINKSMGVKIQDTRDPRINVMMQEAVQAKSPHLQDYSIGGVLMFNDNLAQFQLIRDDGTPAQVLIRLDEMAKTYSEKQQAAAAEKQAKRAAEKQKKDEYTQAQVEFYKTQQR
uniref:Internal virion protein C n=1 Tax=Aeromonas phage vB_AdhaP_MF TaxID=3367373 RepID=A0AB74UPA4_9CAUD